MKLNQTNNIGKFLDKSKQDHNRKNQSKQHIYIYIFPNETYEYNLSEHQRSYRNMMKPREYLHYIISTPGNGLAFLDLKNFFCNKHGNSHYKYKNFLQNFGTNIEISL